METVKTMRDKYAENTRQTLLDTGRRLFVERDYAKLSAEELVRAAGLTRGALYHHFDGKRGLFEAVFDELESQAAQRIRAATAAGSDPLDQAERGIEEFLDVCTDPDYRKIVLINGPIALGWQRWRELDRQHLGRLVIDAARTLLADELIKPYPAELLASALYGALTELSLTLTEVEGGRPQAADLMRDLLGGLTAR
ncbi:TetR/AcrR family transcriptional regulator [Nocardia lijiangensis]|uniref:TetR/AcrR family transcriptional regulator n=1 Tax=Nocardia lijiangensis TaxID=299618 RepID=UPI000A4CF1C6|nr:TetR/AcrR family transcriptional regulator [Nocardia lijiangensis]